MVYCLKIDLYTNIAEQSVRLKSRPFRAGQDKLSQLGRKAPLDASHPQTGEESPPLSSIISQFRYRQQVEGR